MPSTIVYRDVISRFRELIGRAVPQSATVAVVSRGDGDLLQLEGVNAWHFPQRGDGVYLGYYPTDSTAAIQHLETLRDKGAQFLAIPASSIWWLEHYAEFARHLEDHYDLILRDESACIVYALVGGHSAVGPDTVSCTEGEAPSPVADTQQVAGLPGQLREDASILLDSEWYAEQAAIDFDSPHEALTHYLEVGHLRDLSFHPLFDAPWYAVQNPHVRNDGIPALVHYLEYGSREALSPSPWFDTDYYYAQRPNLRKRGVNALVHYVTHASDTAAAHPNPLFRDAYYLRSYPDARNSSSLPFEHFLRFGRFEGRYASHIHRNISDRLRQSSVGSLTRGNWSIGTGLIFAQGSGAGIDARALADRFAASYRIDTVLITLRHSADGGATDAEPRKMLVLEDYELACQIFRPSALRLLAAALCGQRPLFAVSEIPEVIETIADCEVPMFFVTDSVEGVCAAAHARRIVIPSPTVARAARRRGASVSACRPGKNRATSLGKLVARELGIPRARSSGRPSEICKVLIPCSDWNVSGVNAALEAAGKQLVKHGWEVELLFTRNRDTVLESAGDEAHLPSLPYRFLERTRPGIDGMWEALISDVQQSSPCILFLAYDFIANCVVPALTDDVGIVSWVQADDGDYYEQAYRLGRYCNAIVCVSSHIRSTVGALNPAIGERAHVIHNSSISRDEVVRRRPRQPSRMRLIYTGRLVQYQKRVLDYVELARALDRIDVPYELSLVGSFVAREGSQQSFEEQACEHLADGRIRLPGRLHRAQILEELSSHPFFVLLSDFEGLPLSLVEAMGRGCVPIVAESESGIPELVTHGEDGFIISGRDYDRWAEFLVTLWQDRRKLAQVSEQAQNTVLERFTVESIGNQFHQLFSDVAAEIVSGYQRPPALHWGVHRSQTGDVLPAPSLYRPTALQNYPGLT